MLDAIPAMVHSPLRMARPAVREGRKPPSSRASYGQDRAGDARADAAELVSAAVGAGSNAPPHGCAPSGNEFLTIHG
jgi:hypothetical protein